MTLNGIALANFPAGGLNTHQLDELQDGVYALQARATDAAGNTVTTDADLVIDTQAPTILDFELAESSDTGVKGDLSTSYANIEFVGMASEPVYFQLPSQELSSRSGADGRFRLSVRNLSPGSHTFTAAAEDLAGNQGATVQKTISRLEQELPTNPVLLWTNIALDAIRQDATVPTIVTRNLGMLSAAIYDTVNGIERSPGLLVTLEPASDASLEAAIHAAAFEMLRYQYPAQELLLTDFSKRNYFQLRTVRRKNKA